MRLAVIPARGGSKRIPRKNVRNFCGRPMLAWSVSAAIESQCFDRVIVSTDDEEVARVASAAGAECPFMRPAEISDDHTATRPVIAHAIDEMRRQGFVATDVCCLYATAPFTQGADIHRAYQEFLASGAQYLFPMMPFPAPIERAMRRASDGRISMISPDHYLSRSQDLDEAWHDAGQFYWATAKTWQTDAPIFGPESVGIPLRKNDAWDIDSEDDWVIAEALFKMRYLP